MCFAIVILREVVIGLERSMVGAWVAARNGKVLPGVFERYDGVIGLIEMQAFVGCRDISERAG